MNDLSLTLGNRVTEVFHDFQESYPLTDQSPDEIGQYSKEIEADWALDAMGLMCPEPVMLLHNKIREMSQGETLKVLASDPSTQRDIPKFCHFLGHGLIFQNQVEDRFIYLIKKGVANNPES